MDDEIVELAPGRLYRLGGVVDADPRVSWLPEGRAGLEPINCYLLLEGKRAVLMDTGVALHGEQIVAQLETLLPRDATLEVFLTRIELDCISNLGRLVDRFPVECAYTGGVSNPFDFFDDLETSSIVSSIAKLVRIGGDGRIPIGDERELRLTRTRLRLLATTWASDSATGALFTSDSFGYVGVPDASTPPVITTPLDLSVGEVHEHMVTKFDWLPASKTDDIRADLKQIFEAHDPSLIAPGHGCALVGKDVIEQHLALVDDALGLCGKVAA